MLDDDLHAAARAALVRPGVLRVAFQPIVDIARGVVTGYEALTRFAGPPDASPDRWFAAAHEQGVGDLLEARALAAALHAREQLPPNTFLSVNLGPDALLSRAGRGVLERESDLRGVVLEITEQQPIEDYDAMTAALAPLRDAGALIAVDDAGAGFSSLKHITVLRPDLVKVDRDLVAGIDTDPTRAAVVETLGIFASRLDAWLLAEGVETPAELERLLDLGVPLAQGFLLGRPAFALHRVEAGPAAACRRRARRARRSPTAGLAQPAEGLPADASDAAIAEAFLRRPGDEWLVTVDEFERPVAVVARTGARERIPVLAVGADDEPAAIVRRALARPIEHRYAPVAMCDELFRLRGLIQVERLLERLADVAESRAA